MNNNHEKSREELIKIAEELSMKVYLLEDKINEDYVRNFNKKRRDIIYLLNKRSGYKAKDKTLRRYNIIYNESSSKWILND